MPVLSAQLGSCLLMRARFLAQETSIVEQLYPPGSERGQHSAEDHCVREPWSMEITGGIFPQNGEQAEPSKIYGAGR